MCVCVCVFLASCDLSSPVGCTAPSVACDGKYVYVLETSGQLVKVGTGRKGTLLGVVYQTREVTPGWVMLVGEELVLAVVNEEWAPVTWHLVDRETLEVSWVWLA